MDSHYSRPPLILVASEDNQARALIKSCLERAMFAVEECRSVSELFAAHETSTAQVYLIDSGLAGQSGSSLCRRLRHSEHVVERPILVIAGPEDVDRALEDGAFDCILRPIHASLLVKRIEHALSHCRARIESGHQQAHLDCVEKMARTGSWELALGTSELELSAEACRILGRKIADRSSLAREALLDSVVPEDQGAVRAWFDRVAAGQNVAALEHRIALHDGSERIVRHEIESQDGVPVNPGCVAGIVKDITSRRRAEERVSILIERDRPSPPLDRRRFLDRVAQVLRVAQHGQDQAAVVMVDLSIESTLSGPTGEQLFSSAVQRAQDSIRTRDTVGDIGPPRDDVSIARVNENRLAILLPSPIRAHDAYRVADRLHETLSQPIVVGGDEYSIASFFGIALYPGDGVTAEEILSAGEAAVAGARQANKSAIQFFSASLTASAVERLNLETNLSRAIARKELLVYYQPRVDIASNRIVGMEALVRWQHPELGLVHPAQFIPIAEETGLIVPLGKFVLQEACEENRRWQKAGLPEIRMAVNLSSVQFRDPALLDSIVGVLKDVGLEARSLELELTESTLLRKGDTTLATMKELKRMGLHLSIDDFGTGYSSLSYLRRLPIDGLKIDQSFIREVTTNPPDAAITTSIILMGKSLKLRVVAEGVESQSQLTFLSVLECDEAQGYFFSRPIPAADAQALLAKGLAAR